MISRHLWIVLLASVSSFVCAGDRLNFNRLPDLPNELGVAGPFVGVHNDALIVAGGANFPKPIWESQKVWLDDIHVLIRSGDNYRWKDGGKLPRPIAYGAAVSTPAGVVCIGGNDGAKTFSASFLLKWNPRTERITTVDFPALPVACAYGAAAVVNNVIYLAGGQSGTTLDSATNSLWALDLSRRNEAGEFRWKELPGLPGPARAFNLTVGQHDGSEDAVYVISGRRQVDDQVEFLTDVWKYSPSIKNWKPGGNVPKCVMAGTSVANGKHQILVLGGADGSLFHQSDELKDAHPGFPKQAWAYQTDTDTWTAVGPLGANHVTTIAVRWDNSIIIASGEVRPRTRSPRVWSVSQ